MNAGMYSSSTCEWETPQALFDRLNAIYHFETDVCATPDNAKCAKYYTREQDGLAQEWKGVCWMNPPYGREIGKWMHKAYTSAQAGAVVVCLVPARTDTGWWHETVMQGGQIHFVRGRLKFGKSKGNAPFPSAVVVFDGRMGWLHGDSPCTDVSDGGRAEAAEPALRSSLFPSLCGSKRAENRD